MSINIGYLNADVCVLTRLETINLLGAWVMPSAPPVYSDLANQERTEPNADQGWTLPTAPPSYSDVPAQGVGVATAPPIIPDMTNLSLNPCPDLPPPTYDDAMRDKGNLT